MNFGLLLLVLKSLFVLLFFSFRPAFANSPNSGQTIPVSVTAFTNKSSTSGDSGESCHSWAWFGNELGTAFSDILIENLKKNPKIEVYERENLNTIYENEVDLVNSNDQSIKRGEFKKAKITFIGVVDGFEYCEEGSKIAVNIGSLFGIGDIVPAIKTSNATVSVLVRAIETQTGKVIVTARSKKEQKKNSLGLFVSVGGFDFGGTSFKQSALNETIQETLKDVSQQLLEKINELKI